VDAGRISTIRGSNLTAAMPDRHARRGHHRIDQLGSSVRRELVDGDDAGVNLASRPEALCDRTLRLRWL
jgi:hypothetical protein